MIIYFHPMARWWTRSSGEIMGYLWYLTSYLRAQNVLAIQKIIISEFWHGHCDPWVKICKYTILQLNPTICWHSNIIWMTFWTILWYLTSYLASQYRLTPSKSQNVKILTSQSVFHPKKLNYTHSETNRVILLRFPAF